MQISFYIHEIKVKAIIVIDKSSCLLQVGRVTQQGKVLLRSADSTASGRDCWPTGRTSSTTPSTTSRNALREPEADDAVEKETEGAAPQARDSPRTEPQARDAVGCPDIRQR
jgi:hypothetical protein